MTPEPIPQPVRDLINERIDSVGQLEVLLFLQACAPGQLTSAEAAAALRMEPAWMAAQFAVLRDRGLAEEDSGHFRYLPANQQLAAAVDELRSLYTVRRVAVIELILAKPAEDLRAFADAFRLARKKEPPRG